MVVSTLVQMHWINKVAFTVVAVYTGSEGPESDAVAFICLEVNAKNSHLHQDNCIVTELDEDNGDDVHVS